MARTAPGSPAQQMARLGVARTFQITSLFPGLTTLDNIVAASYRTGRTGWAHALLRRARIPAGGEEGRGTRARHPGASSISIVTPTCSRTN